MPTKIEIKDYHIRIKAQRERIERILKGLEVISKEIKPNVEIKDLERIFKEIKKEADFQDKEKMGFCEQWMEILLLDDYKHSKINLKKEEFSREIISLISENISLLEKRRKERIILYDLEEEKVDIPLNYVVKRNIKNFSKIDLDIFEILNEILLEREIKIEKITEEIKKMGWFFGIIWKTEEKDIFNVIL